MRKLTWVSKSHLSGWFRTFQRRHGRRIQYWGTKTMIGSTQSQTFQSAATTDYSQIQSEKYASELWFQWISPRTNYSWFTSSKMEGDKALEKPWSEWLTLSEKEKIPSLTSLLCLKTLSETRNLRTKTWYNQLSNQCNNNLWWWMTSSCKHWLSN